MEEITYQCKYYVVRYVASPIRDEAINIGIILKSTAPLDWYGCKFTRDLSNLDASQTDKNLEYIKQMEELLTSTGQRRVKNECKRINL